MMNDETKRELQMFKEFSSVEDYNKVTGDEISFSDYRRLSYILNVLEMGNLGVYFHNKYCDRFKDKEKELEELREEYSTYDSEEVEIGEYIAEMCEEWLQEFAMKIEDETTREIVVEKFRVRR